MSARRHERRSSSSSGTSYASSQRRSIESPITNDNGAVHTTTYIPVLSPPTPAPSPSPRPFKQVCPNSRNDAENPHMRDVRHAFQQLDSGSQNTMLAELLSSCTIETLVHLCNVIAPRIKRDFLKDLPTEVSLHILSFIDDPKTLVRASAVSKYWRSLLVDDYIWKRMCHRHKFCCPERLQSSPSAEECHSPRARIVRRLSFLDSDHSNDQMRGGSPSDEDISMDEDQEDKLRYGHHAVPESSQSALAEFKMQLDCEDSGIGLVPLESCSDSDLSDASSPHRTGIKAHHTSQDAIEKHRLEHSANTSCHSTGLLSEIPSVRSECIDGKGKGKAVPPQSNFSRLRRKHAPAPLSYRHHFKVSYLTGTDLCPRTRVCSRPDDFCSAPQHDLQN